MTPVRIGLIVAIVVVWILFAVWMYRYHRKLNRIARSRLESSRALQRPRHRRDV